MSEVRLTPPASPSQPQAGPGGSGRGGGCGNGRAPLLRSFSMTIWSCAFRFGTIDARAMPRAPGIHVNPAGFMNPFNSQTQALPRSSWTRPRGPGARGPRGWRHPIGPFSATIWSWPVRIGTPLAPRRLDSRESRGHTKSDVLRAGRRAPGRDSPGGTRPGPAQRGRGALAAWAAVGRTWRPSGPGCALTGSTSRELGVDGPCGQACTRGTVCPSRIRTGRV